MSKCKKIILTIIAVVLITGYVAGASFALDLLFKPTLIEVIEFGDFNVINADNEIDENDENENTLYNNINNHLLFTTQSELNQFKLMTLFKIYKKEGASSINEGETIVIEVSKKIAEDLTLKVIKVDSATSIQSIDSNVEKRIRENTKGIDEEYYVLLFNVEEEGYYGLVSQRGEASFAWVLVLFSLIAIVTLFFILFIFIKPKHRKLNNL